MTRAGRHPSICGVFASIALISGSVAAAQVADDAQDAVIVAAGQATDSNGRIAVNLIAGSENQQVSSVVLAQGDVASTGNAVRQTMQAFAGEGRVTSIAVEGDAFSGNSGLISVNLTAGAQNQSANLATLAIGNDGAISDQMLEQSRASIEPSGGNEAAPVEANDSVAVSDEAFSNSSGLIQVNLIGGERNSSANTFSLNVSAGGQP